MEVIDLLNMISKGEEMPEKIKVDNSEYKYEESLNTYFEINEEHKTYSLVQDWLVNTERLNYEVEIIEEDKPIEEFYLRNEKGEILIGANMFLIENKINELVKEINKMKEELNGKNN